MLLRAGLETFLEPVNGRFARNGWQRSERSAVVLAKVDRAGYPFRRPEQIAAVAVLYPSLEIDQNPRTARHLTDKEPQVVTVVASSRSVPLPFYARRTHQADSFQASLGSLSYFGFGVLVHRQFSNANSPLEGAVGLSGVGSLNATWP